MHVSSTTKLKISYIVGYICESYNQEMGGSICKSYVSGNIKNIKNIRGF